ncbi:MAG: hydroxyacid dehydrogenase [Candidatus Accumulibacter sp.]|nr:hydroxyacid dehydrogenase [Accumulibacter sp.]
MTELCRGRRVLVTHERLADEAVRMLNDNDVDVLFSPPYTPSDELAEKLARWQVDALIVRQGKITAPVIAASRKLRVIAKHGVGVDNVDLKAAAERSIPVVRAAGSNARAVAEMAIALAVALLKELPHLDASIKNGQWLKPTFVGRDIRDAVLGLVGFGSIGQEAAQMARALGFRIVAHDPHGREAILSFDAAVERSFEELLAEADVISLHCPLTHETRGMIGQAQFAKMKSGAILVNTARGGLIDEAALLVALQEGRLSGAGLDSFAQEPPNPANPLWQASNLIVTPHVAGVSHGSTRAMAMMAARQVIDILDGKAPEPRNLVRLDECATA